MDFWTGAKTACSTKVSYDNTSDTEVDSWAVAFESVLDDPLCDDSLTLIIGGGFAANDAFRAIPFKVIKCYEALKEQLLKQPTSHGTSYLACLKAGIVAVGYDVD